MIGLNFLVIPFTLLIGLMLLILPLPDWAQTYRPDWVALILIYWSMALPKKIGLWFAFLPDCWSMLLRVPCWVSTVWRW